MRALLLSVASTLALACGDGAGTGGGGDAPAGTSDTSSRAASSASASTAEATSSSTGTGEACPINEIAMIVSSSGGVPERFHVRVRRDGEDAALLFDTGSATTFVRLDGGGSMPDAATLELGCDTVTVDGRSDLADLGEVDGLPVIGILGVDYVAAGTTSIDAATERLTRHPIGTTLPETQGWSVLPYDDVHGLLIAPVGLDGEALRLMVDTGAAHTLWLGEEGQPGDIEVTTTDAQGTPVYLYYGEVTLALAGEPARQAPVFRAPSFPYFEATVAALGGDIHGLLGLSAFEDRRYVIDGAAHRVLVEPAR